MIEEKKRKVKEKVRNAFKGNISHKVHILSFFSTCVSGFMRQGQGAWLHYKTANYAPLSAEISCFIYKWPGVTALYRSQALCPSRSKEQKVIAVKYQVI